MIPDGLRRLSRPRWRLHGRRGRPAPWPRRLVGRHIPARRRRTHLARDPGRQALVALDAGHAGVQRVAVTTDGIRVRFRLPGRPLRSSSTAVLTASGIVGTVRQSDARGTFRARRGRAPELVARGLYTAGGGVVVGVVDDPYGPARLVDLATGRVRALFPLGSRFLIGAGSRRASRAPGVATFGAERARIDGVSLRRVALRRSRCASRAQGQCSPARSRCPPGAGRIRPSPGSPVRARPSAPTCPTSRRCSLRHGVAVLAYDKRGVGQSSGSYPGESPTVHAIDVLARDAAAAVRFLAAQPDVDRSRVGLAGHSQAGLDHAARGLARAAGRFLIAFSGPAVTADENDLFQDLAGEGERPSALTDDEIDAGVLPAAREGSTRSRRSGSCGSRALGLRRPRPPRPAPPLRAPAPTVRRRPGARLHRRRLPECESRPVETTTG